MQLLCLGDIAFANRDPNQTAWKLPAGFVPSEETRILLNWEFPMGKVMNETPRVRGMRFCADPESIEVVRDWAPGIATLATNHILDAGEDGLFRTINSLQQAGFATVGARMSASEIAQPLFWESREGQLAIVNWVFAETHPDWMAVPGPNCWPGFDAARNIIQAIKQRADWTIAVLHWSDELFPYPLPTDREIARALAGMGVDAVIGHHPHVVRGMETLGSCPVFYSLGNYYFAEIRSETGEWVSQEAPRNREGLGVKLSFRRGSRTQYDLLSFWNTGNEVHLDERRRAEKRLTQCSAPLGRDQNGQYLEWYRRTRAGFDRWGSRWHFGLMRRGLIETLRRLISRSLKLQY